MYSGIMLLLLSACSANTGNEEQKEGGNTSQATEKNESEKVTITVAFDKDEDFFESRFGAIEEKLGNVKLEMVPFFQTWTELEEMFASGTVPDIIYSANFDTNRELLEADLVYPIEELISKSDLNLDDINPSLISYARSFDPEGSLIGLPDGVGYKVLFYNKDVFDLFGMEYPTGEMTWEEAIELGKKMTGERNGQNYTGLLIDLATAPLDQWAVNPVDPDTDEVLLLKEPAFKKYYDLMERYYNIPGLYDVGVDGDWFAQGFAAMKVGYHQTLMWSDVEDKKDSIDIAPIPTWPELPGTHPYLTTTPMIIMKDSKHVEEAFAVLKEYVSKENQLNISRTMSSGTVLMDKEVFEQTGADVPIYEGKNIDAFYELTPAELKRQSRWDRIVDYKLEEFAESEDDAATFLRKLQEEVEIKIKEEKAKMD
ncbi:extracellular solute-binding protein [Lederbergia sp. NSJ-179]|uniref:ABC transporter substrate-binding protein n=1 Tax=Lederbergia sp. NSJ-179 TaxID=2931402 RepID=UPI001FD46732|nr:extracellular solute-binding protein [Lederbergia sp. NSJ-179]MCJ7841057.1 extracellular solute-binding protein [Lederbergia sp. NSJ-179]